MSSNLKTVCNRCLRAFDRTIRSVLKIRQDRSIKRYHYNQAKVFLREFPVYRSIIVAIRELEPGRNLKLNVDSDAAHILTDHELAFRLSPEPFPFTPWFFKDHFLVVHACHLRKILDTVTDLLFSKYRHIKPRKANDDLPF